MSKNNKSNVKNSKTINTIQIGNKIEKIVVNIICLLVFVAFGYIAVMSMIQTSKIDPANYGNEVILYETDNIALNLLFVSMFFVFLFAMKKRYDFFKKVNMKALEFALPCYVAVLGFVWVLSVQSSPAADSQNIFEAASNATQGNFQSMHDGGNFYNKDFYSGYSYFNFYPFQLGFVLISEVIYRIFGTSSAMPIEIMNVLCVAMAYMAITMICKLLFKRRSIEFFTIIFLAGCFQPILFCTFAYGNILGMCCALWASYFLIKYLQTSKYILLLPCSVLLTLATLAKFNNMIYVVAFVIVLIIHTIKQKKWQSVAFALAICIMAVGASNLVIMSYESRANTTFKNGVSQTLYLDMGLNESYMAPGWYNDIAKSTYISNGLDDKKSNKAAMQDINNRFKYKFSDIDYTVDFFGKKILSQWNEPTFESIWVSKVKGHYSELNSLANGVYDGSTGQFFGLYFNLYIQILYILFAVGLYCMFLNKKNNIETVLLPLIILGGFGYHLLFEGKSQYVLTYIPLLIPVASYGISCILNGKYSKIKEIVAKLKYIPEKKKAK